MAQQDVVVEREPRFYKVSEAAQILRVSPMTIYRAIDEGQFPAVRVRSRYSVPVKAIDEMASAAMKANGVVNASQWVPPNAA